MSECYENIFSALRWKCVSVSACIDKQKGRDELFIFVLDWNAELATGANGRKEIKFRSCAADEAVSEKAEENCFWKAIHAGDKINQASESVW